jgi:uncharacterized membrane protein YbhN (UPF0104 family)
MLKTVFITTLKFVVAAGLIWWLLQSGKLDLRLLAQLKHFKLEVAGALFLIFFNIVLISIRWESILQARATTRIPIFGMVKISWIGQFFSTVLPGTVSGDLIKVLYVQNYNPELSKKFLFASALIDRMTGLAGVILLVGLSSLFFSGHILDTAPDMKPILLINFALVGVVLAALAVFSFRPGLVRQLIAFFERLFFPSLWQRLGTMWDELVSIKRRMLGAVLIALVVQFTSVLTFWLLIHPFVGNKMDFFQALAFIPLGLMTLTLPIAPSGLGVGHAIFQKLFELSGIENGASIFNLYFVMTLVVNVLGVIPYLMAKSRRELPEQGR